VRTRLVVPWPVLLECLDQLEGNPIGKEGRLIEQKSRDPSGHGKPGTRLSGIWQVALSAEESIVIEASCKSDSKLGGVAEHAIPNSVTYKNLKSTWVVESGIEMTFESISDMLESLRE